MLPKINEEVVELEFRLQSFLLETTRVHHSAFPPKGMILDMLLSLP